MGIELKILDWIQELRTPAGDVIMPLITRLGDGGMIWILLTAVFLLIPKTRKTGAVLAAALCIDLLLCNVLLKNLVARTRPFDRNPMVELLIARPGDFSFPSGHTAASFAAAAALYFSGESRWWKPVLAAAVLTAVSRLYLYVHYPTDVLGGIAVGVLSGYLGYCLVKGRGRNEADRNEAGGNDGDYKS